MRVRILSPLILLLVGLAAPARAELVFFANGQSMSVKGHRTDGDRLVLLLRSGGELACDTSMIQRIAPDEVAHDDDNHGIRESRLGNPPANSGSPVSTSTADADVAIDRYGAVIDKIAAEQGVPVKLVRAVIRIESGGEPQARSVKGAVGLMQLMPQTARLYTSRDPYEPVTNIEAGIKHLRMLLDRFPLALALAAYNAGEAAVQRFGGIPPYPETQRYVARVLQLVAR